jgi:methionine synthase II (cobalamin-independent)
MVPTQIGPLARADTITDLQQAYADYDAGKIQKDELVKAQDKSVEDSLSNMAQTGETLITDGEQRASS